MKNIDLLQILLCPSCKKGKLHYEDGNGLSCKSCGHRYGFVMGEDVGNENMRVDVGEVDAVMARLNGRQVNR